MIAMHVGREQEFTALGKRWKLGRLTRAVWDEFLAWARTVLPDPLDVIAAKVDRLPEALQKQAVRDAIELSQNYLSPDSPAVRELLGSLPGSVRMLWLLLRKHQPQVTEDEAFEMLVEVGSAVMAAKFRGGERADAAEGAEPEVRDAGAGAGADGLAAP